MEKIDLPFFYQLGMQLNALTKMKVQPQTRLEIVMAGWYVSESINKLFEWSGGINVCRSSGQECIKAADDIRKRWNDLTQQEREKSNPLTDMMWQNLINRAIKFETVLKEELATLSAYSVSKKGIYSTSDLIDNAEKVFPTSVLNTFSPDIVQEIQEAGKCLAFDIPTASGFHMLRVTEGVLHEYYLAVGQPKKKDKLKNWGAYIAYLHKLTEPGANTTKETVNHIKKVLALLQQVKDQDRNLIMHPDIVLNMDEAFILFETTKTAIMTMTEKLPLFTPPVVKSTTVAKP